MASPGSEGPAKRSLPQKLVREAIRPLRQLTGTRSKLPASASQRTVIGYPMFNPLVSTVEPEGARLIDRLVRESGEFPGPIIEIGTLLGVNTTSMALAKRPEQRIITVDLYCWNPWGLPPDMHETVAAQMLRYLVATGHVERVRMDKNKFFETYQGPAPSMVFLDAMHDYTETKKDIVWAQRVGAKIIAGHDYSDDFPGVMKIVDEMGGPRRLGGTVWVL